MIAVKLVGRIGNQLFIYAAAEAIRQKRGRNEKIVFYDESILREGWKNSLENYDLKNVEFRHDYSRLEFGTRLQMAFVLRFYRWFKLTRENRVRRFKFEKFFQPILNFFGIISCIDGYTKIITPLTKNVYMDGYFQSERYFQGYENLLKKTFSYRLPVLKNKDNVKQLIQRESVCISIKVEHNVGHPSFDVCDKSYYTRAIDYITKHIENPLFFICSDNVPYVLEHFIDTAKYDYLCQDKELDVSDSLAIMGTCKNFIIGNTSFGWWAQYLSDNENKIVVAPDHWYRDPRIACDIYQDNWHYIDVSEYISHSSLKD